jgi:hypothetical protein
MNKRTNLSARSNPIAYFRAHVYFKSKLLDLDPRLFELCGETHTLLISEARALTGVQSLRTNRHGIQRKRQFYWGRLMAPNEALEVSVLNAAGVETLGSQSLA